MCPVTGCTITFESEDDLNTRIAATLYKILPLNPRTANDIAGYHLINTLQSTTIESLQDPNIIRKKQSSSSLDISTSVYYQHSMSIGWAFQTLKHTNSMSEKVKQFIEDVWIESQTVRSKLTPQLAQQQMHSLWNNSNDKK